MFSESAHLACSLMDEHNMTLVITLKPALVIDIVLLVFGD